MDGFKHRSYKNYVLLKGFCHFVMVVHHLVVIEVSVMVLVRLKDHCIPVVRMLYTMMPYYATNWNFAFQTTFLSLSLAYDVLQWLDKHKGNLGKRLKYVRDVVFNGLVVPFTCFVNSMFWIVYWIDRELVFPTVYDEILPWWLNHCVHTNIIIVVIIETLLTSRRHPTDARVERICYVFISLFYAVVFYSIYFFAGCWLYGVFGVMTWWQVCLYQLAIWASAYIFYKSIFIINRLIHREDEKDDERNGDVDSKELQLGLGRQDFESAKGDFAKSGTEFKSNGGAVESKDNELGNDGVVNRSFEIAKGDELSRIDEAVSEKNLSQPFDKSWSTKYRSSRGIENSSL